MKKLLSILLTLTLFTPSVTAFASDILGNTIYTDIVTYINHYPIPSYNFNGNTLIAAEDLQNYGFNVFWNEYARTLTITRNNNNEIYPEYTFRPLEKQLGKKNFAITTTDVRVFTENYQYASYGGIDGKTLININDLTCIDNVSVVWVPEVKAVKIWVNDGLDMCESPFSVRRINDNFTYYETCSGFDNSCIQCQVTPLSDSLVITVAETTGEYSDTCIDCYATITITDIIDADGNSRLKNKKIFSYDRPSVGPYFYDFSDYVLSHFLMIDNDDLYPCTASADGGLIKLKYSCNSIYEISMRVSHLPCENHL